VRDAVKRSEPGRPLVSIITSVKNAQSSLESTIKSIFSQKYTNLEYIVIDGGSTDGSVDIIKKYQNLIDYWISEPDQNIYEAWNKGIIVSRGDWIGFLGAGDVYYEDAIYNYISALLEIGENSVEYISSRAELISEKNKVLRIIGQPWQWRNFKKYMNVVHIGSLHHKRLFQDNGLFDTNFKICGDYELLLRRREALKAGFVNKITVRARIGGISHNCGQALEETMRAKRATGKRRKSLCYVEKYLAMLKFCTRSAIYSAHDKFI
jgi:glycosyltransferase involved in cell wall biosynthesis